MPKLQTLRSIPASKLIYPTGEGGDRGQVSGAFWGLILPILCSFAELSVMPSKTNSSFNNFAQLHNIVKVSAYLTPHN